jgi:2-oxoglutarate dehydrogenase E1 component
MIAPKLTRQSSAIDWAVQGFLGAENGGYLDALYEDFLRDPNLISSEWRECFASWRAAQDPSERSHRSIRESLKANLKGRSFSDTRQIGVLQYINAYRFLGNRIAHLDPLDRHERPVIVELTLEHYGLDSVDPNQLFDTGSLVGPEKMTLASIQAALVATYSSTVGVDYMYLASIEQKRWIQNRFEGCLSRWVPKAEQQILLLEQITAAETLERYLHTRFVGQKRFSLEGGESLIPCLNELIERAASLGVEELVIGMAHRGRLNVLVNCLGKMPRELFEEFEGVHSTEVSSGDVKYHMGFASDVTTKFGGIHLTLAFNPSHLEIVNPVVEGSVRARQDRRGDSLGVQVLPVLIHGDAALAGQGVVMETLALSKTRGYSTGGTVHLVINNQIGFTTSDPRDTRSSTYCTDIAKMIDAPVFHVNGDDPEQVILVTQIALDYRMQYHADVVVDIVCYRRLGHNEQDEPMVTQPWMYRRINQHSTTRSLYANKLILQGIISGDQCEELVQSYRRGLESGVLKYPVLSQKSHSSATLNWSQFQNKTWRTLAVTAVSLVQLKILSERLTTIPADFSLHPSVKKIIDNRASMGQGLLPVDWGMGENLAYASLLAEGYSIRLAGQDSGRGTFFHRHAVLHDQNRQRWDTGSYIPLEHITADQGSVQIINSILSEEAVLGYEYGYSTASPNCLVLWEAQFGDFANGAQVVIDQFISSGEAKWGRLCGMVLLLPHGYEGQGPEHSSARLERYMQLCAEYNLQICVPTTAAQIFHVLRRQMLRPLRKPLVVFSPKSLLRKKEACSNLTDFAEGSFQPLIDEVEPVDIAQLQGILICCGKIYYDLLQERQVRKNKLWVIVRLEQLYPFPHDEFKELLVRYAQVKHVRWVQEEPRNQGAWHRIRHYLLQHLHPDQQLSYALRPSAAAPAVGHLALHKQQQQSVLDAAFTPPLSS